MKISLIDKLGIGNPGAVANAGRDAARRHLEDEAIERLVAALARREALRPETEIRSSVSSSRLVALPPDAV